VLAPCAPLGLALQVQCTGLSGVVVTNCGLLEETVELQELIVRWGLGEVLGFLGGGVELSIGRDPSYRQIRNSSTQYLHPCCLWLELLNCF